MFLLSEDFVNPFPSAVYIRETVMFLFCFVSQLWSTLDTEFAVFFVVVCLGHVLSI